MRGEGHLEEALVRPRPSMILKSEAEKVSNMQDRADSNNHRYRTRVASRHPIVEDKGHGQTSSPVCGRNLLSQITLTYSEISG